MPHLSGILYGLILVELELNDYTQAKEHLKYLKKIDEETNHKNITLRANYATALVLKASETINDLGKAAEQFTEILAEYPEMPIILLANKQDTPNSLDPTAISKVMGLDSYAMVAIDLAYRNDLLQILVKALSDYFDVDIPDIPVEQILCIEGEA